MLLRSFHASSRRFSPRAPSLQLNAVTTMANDVTSTESAEARQMLYERDFYTWGLQQALTEHRFEELDWENLADEVEGLAKTERRELRSRLGCCFPWTFEELRNE